ncbi:MAG: hypothetical protein IID17_01555 [Nitrospinae bacterium]|nr:hypothetical protein [Nitrospinota bacterium]
MKGRYNRSNTLNERLNFLDTFNLGIDFRLPCRFEFFVVVRLQRLEPFFFWLDKSEQSIFFRDDGFRKLLGILSGLLASLYEIDTFGS